MPPTHLAPGATPPTGRYLSFQEREDIGRDRQVMPAIRCRDAEPALADCMQVVDLHQFCNATTTDALPLGTQSRADTRAAIAFMAVPVNASNVAEKVWLATARWLGERLSHA